MNIPKHFAEDRTFVLHDFIRSHPLALLTNVGADGRVSANLVPMTIHEDSQKGVLRCHLAKPNIQLENLTKSEEVLVIFS